KRVEAGLEAERGRTGAMRLEAEKVPVLLKKMQEMAELAQLNGDLLERSKMDQLRLQKQVLELQEEAREAQQAADRSDRDHRRETRELRRSLVKASQPLSLIHRESADHGYDGSGTGGYGGSGYGNGSGDCDAPETATAAAAAAGVVAVEPEVTGEADTATTSRLMGDVAALRTRVRELEAKVTELTPPPLGSDGGQANSNGGGGGSCGRDGDCNRSGGGSGDGRERGTLAGEDAAMKQLHTAD
ncbi:unnamed protein product, partial [Phaeothamnion confervicola]